MKDEWWTTEDVAEFLEITTQQVYESRRRSEYPGALGQRRGRSLAFLRSQVEAGPQEPETTNDPTTAILWALEGIHKTLRAIHTELRAQRPVYFDVVVDEVTETTIEIEEEE